MTSPDRDILISRVVDGTALDHDWAAMEALAEKDTSLWRDLAQSQRQHAALTSIVSAAGRVADEVDIEIPESHIAGRLNSLARWGGWAAAAAVALAWVGGMRFGGGNTAGPPGGFFPPVQSDDPGEALKEYYERGGRSGTVLGEMPAKVILQTSPAPNGSGYDVYYLRQIVEKARVSDLYRMSNDELGRTEALPARVRAHSTSGSY